MGYCRFLFVAAAALCKIYFYWPKLIAIAYVASGENPYFSRFSS